MKENKTKLPYSYHTFLFPFIWKTSQTVEITDFENILSVGTRWFETSWHAETIPDTQDKDKWMQDYQAFQYFTKPANNAIFNTRKGKNKENVVKTYSYYPHGNNHSKLNGEYTVVKGNRTYKLVINNIRLNVYDVGVAILVFEMENHNYRDIDSVNAINEHGRRVNFPFLQSDGSHKLCADSISISFDGELFSSENFLEKSKRIEKEGLTFLEKFTLNYIMQPIQKLLDNDGVDNGGYTVTAHESHKSKNKFYIKPCVDDRMFVCCLIADNELSTELKQNDVKESSYLRGLDTRLKNKNTSGEVIDLNGIVHESYMLDWLDETTLSSRLYKYIYVENELNCQDANMKKRLLENSIYSRWINAGTIYAATHHSLCCITNPYVEKEVINPFLIEYVQMAILVLAQRSAILLLEDEVANVVNVFNSEIEINKEQISEIEKLQEKYIKVQNQLLISELTVQEQGVEIYELIREQLYIDKNMNDLNSKMVNLREVANIANARIESKLSEENNAIEEAKNEIEKEKENTMELISIILVLLSICEPLAMWMSLDDKSKIEGHIWFIFSSVVFLIVLVIYIVKKIAVIYKSKNIKK